ncbi:MAG: CpaF family protein [Lachnospiraceae bacterium]|nr:CpaF family protein [Lachnospiraceae bacterium]
MKRSEEYEALRQSIRLQLMDDMDYTRDISDEEILEMIDRVISGEGMRNRLSLQEKRNLRKELFAAIRKLDALETFLSDPSVTEIMVNGADCIFTEKAGRLEKESVTFESAEKLADVIQQIVARVNRVVNETSPIVDARLSDGSRVNVVMPPIALNGPILTIRKFPEDPIRIEDLLRIGSVTEEVVAFLKDLVVARYNIFISGGTGSGKTTFLNALSDFIPKDERIITIEDNAELQLRGVDNLVRLETRNANVEGCNAITIRDLIKSSLRMRPDRIVVGEVRGDEAIDLLMAMNTGHDGSLSTGHANSASDMLVRLETMVLMGMEMPLAAIRRQIASAIDIIVHLGRLRDHSRKVLQISEVIDYIDGEVVLSPLYRFRETGEDAMGKVKGTLEKVGVLEHTEKLERCGIGLAGNQTSIIKNETDCRRME